DLTIEHDPGTAEVAKHKSFYLQRLAIVAYRDIGTSDINSQHHAALGLDLDLTLAWPTRRNIVENALHQKTEAIKVKIRRFDVRIEPGRPLVARRRISYFSI